MNDSLNTYHYNPKVLIIEDDETLLQVLIDKFSNSDFDVLYSNNGEKGLEMALRDKPDVILLDIIMPKMDGEQVLRKLREDAWGADVPVIVLSNIEPKGYLSGSMTKNKPVKYLIKANNSIDSIVACVNQAMAD